MPPVDQTSTQTSGILRALNVGSGVDIPALAQGLAEAENLPRIQSVKQSKAKAEISVSAYGLVSNSLGSIKEVFDLFSNKSSLHKITSNGFDTNVLTAVPDSAATAGEYAFTVNALA